jgi:hypothetical protein
MKIFFATLLVLCWWSAVGSAAWVEGRVVLKDGPLPGMQVQAFSDLDPSGAPLGPAAVTNQEGLFRLEVPAGFVAVYARTEDGRYFAFCGRNPIQTGSTTQWAGLQAVTASATTYATYEDEYSAAVEGVVSLDGKPVAGAFVALYLDVSDDLKGQGYRISAPTGDDGFFAFDGLPESDYFLVARKRQNLARVGPLVAGDLLGIFPGNPLNLKSGKTAIVHLPVVERQPSTATSALPDRAGSVFLGGRILDADGQPLANLHFFAYRDPVIGHQRPAAISAPSGVDGRFAVSFHEPGRYYVGAREAYGDSPAPGELFGLYTGRADHSLEIVPGKNPEIEIRVNPIRLD